VVVAMTAMCMLMVIMTVRMFAILGVLLVLHNVRQSVEENISKETAQCEAQQHMNKPVPSLT